MMGRVDFQADPKYTPKYTLKGHTPWKVYLRRLAKGLGAVLAVVGTLVLLGLAVFKVPYFGWVLIGACVLCIGYSIGEGMEDETSQVD